MTYKSAVILTVLSFIGLIGFVSSCTTVDSGTVGVVKTLGAIQPHPLREGLHFVAPIGTSVIDVNTQMQNAEAQAMSSSSDLQAVNAVVTVQYSLHADHAPRLVSRFGDPEGIGGLVLAPAIQEAVKAVTSQYTAEHLVTMRGQVKASISAGIVDFVDKTLADKGCKGGLTIANVAVTDFHFSKEFDAAIELKVKAEQDALKAKKEKEKLITQAEADARKRELEGDSDAYKLTAISKARAEAIEREAKALRDNPALVELRIAERWNGQLPQYTGGGMPMIQFKTN